MPLPRARWTASQFVSLSIAFVVAIALFVAPSAKAFPVVEPFTNNTVASPNWKFGTQNNGGTANNYALTAPSDGQGNGWLRLTQANANERGWAYYDQAFASNQGLVLEFDYAMYGGTGADGIAAFLYNGSTGAHDSLPNTNAFRVGGVGGSLGYCPRAEGGYAALRNAWVAVALDRFGNFSSNTHCTGGSAAATPNAIVVRGPTMTAAPLAVVPVPGGLETGNRAGARKVRMVITSDYRLTVSIVAANGTSTTYITNLQLPTPPATLKFGYAGVTGGSTNIQEIRGGSSAPMSDLATTVTDSAASGNRAAARTWTTTVTNSGPNSAVSASINAITNAQSLTGVTWTCTASGGAACGTGSGTGLPTNQATGAIPNGGTLTYAITGTPAAATDYAELTVTASTPGDPTLTNNSATDSTWLTPVIDGNPGVSAASGVITAVPAAARGGNITTTHEWLRCDENGANCNVIAGQTGSSYTLTAADRGSTVRYRQTATNAAGSTTAVSTTIPLPATILSSAPSGNVSSTTANFQFSSLTPGVTYECRLDAGAWTACSSPLTLSALAQGSHTFAVRAVAAGGADPTPATATWVVDTGAPDTTISTVVPARINTSSQALSFTGTDAGGSGVAGFQCRVDSGTWTTCTSPNTFTGLTDGSHTLAVRSVDAAGNVDPTPDTRTTIVDTGAPTSTFTATPPASSNATTASFTFTASDAGGTGVARIECRLDAAAWATCTSPQNLTGVTQGSHTFQIRAVDNAGNTQSPVTGHTWTVDTTAPDTGMVTGIAPGSVRSTVNDSVVFSGTDTGGTGIARYECRLDGAAWATCTSPHPLIGLSQGAHTIEVRAIDNAGNVDQTPTSISWTVDSVAPETGAVTGVPAVTNASTASLTFTGTDASGSGIARFECSLDGAAYATCTSPRSLTGLAAGTHTFSVRAVDNGGLADASPSSIAWIVDQTAPTTDAITGVGAITNQSTASLSFSGSDTGGGTIARYECSLDGAAFATCTSPRSLTGLAAGSHTFEVRAVDTAGNTDATPSTRTWTVDLSAPQTDAITGVPAITNSPTASLTFSGTDTGGGTVASFECRLDAGAWAACTSPRSLTGLTQGSHTFAARAIDSAGNTDASPSTLTWVVDTTAPDTGAITGVANVTNQTTASLSFVGTDTGGGTIARYECSLDGAAFATCTSPRSLTGLAAGSHTLEVRAVDTAGNTDASPSTRTWTVDLTDPDTTITTPTPASSNATSIQLAFTGSDAAGIASYECRIDSGAWAACTSPHTFSGLTTGNRVLQVRAIDNAGNADATPATRSIQIDNTAPTSTFTTTPNTVTGSTTANFAFTATDGSGSGIARIECSLDGATFATCSSPQNLSGITAGSHTFAIRAVDSAGNTQAPATSFTWTVDLVAPETDAITGVDPDSDSASASLSFSGTDAGGTGINGFECRLDGGSWTACTSPRSLTGLSDGNHALEVRAVDQAGNRDASPSTITWRVDTTAPETGTITGVTPTTYESTATLNFSGTDTGGSGVASYECRLDAGAWADCTSPHVQGGLDDGSHTFYVRAIDVAGNTDATPSQITWTVDNGSPQTTLTNSPPANTNNDDVTLEFTGVDSSGPVYFECRLDAGSWNICTSPFTFEDLTEGVHTLRVRAVDSSGNSDPTPPTVTVRIDTAEPTSTITSGPPAATTATGASIAFTASDAGGSGIDRVECRIDASAWGNACTSPWVLGGLTEGEHTVQVRAVDNAGNIQSTPVLYTWRIDTTAPQTGAITGVAPLTGVATAELSFSGTDTGGSGVASYECQLDGGAWTACTSPRNLTGLSDGNHTFRTRAIDAAGNTDATPSSITWQVDTSAPTTGPITGVPANTDETSATLTFTGSGASFECRIDGGSWGPCSSPLNLPILAEGVHTAEVRSVSAAGVRDDSPSTVTWRVDTTAPTVNVPTTLPADSADRDLAVTFNGADAGSGIARFECRVDGDTRTTCTSPHTFSGLADGEHELEVRAVDNAGNPSTPWNHTVTVDATAPTTTLDETPDAISSSDEATFTFTADDGGSGVDTIECRVDDGTWSDCASPLELTGLTDGMHSLDVRATDELGNVESPVTRYEWRVDTTAPTTGAITGIAPITTSDSATLSFTGADAGGSGVDGFECRLDGDAWDACTAPQALAGLDDGERTFEVRAIDEAGNADASPSTITWRVDTVSPETGAISGVSPITGSTTASLVFTGSDPAPGSGIAGYECQVDGGAWDDCTSPLELTGLADGDHTVRVRAIDEAGNVDATPSELEWEIDSAIPTTSPITGVGQYTDSSDVTLSFTGSGTGFECSRDDGPWTSCASPLELTDLPDGAHKIEVRAVGSAGVPDDSPSEITFRVDTAAPSTTVSSTVPADTNQRELDVDFTGADDGGSGIDGFECRLDETTWEPCTSPHTFEPLADGDHVLEVRSIDRAGNPDAAPWRHEVTVDGTAPTTTLGDTPAALDDSSTAGFTFTAADGSGSGIDRIECRRDGGAWAPCTSPLELTGLADGDHELEVRAVDRAGNTEDPAISFEWTVDTTAPVLSPVTGVAAVTTATNANLSFSATDASGIAGYECRVDNGTWEPCSSPLALTSLADGSHTVDVRAIDDAGNRSQVSSRTWRVDTTDPETGAITGVSNVSGQASPSLSFTGTDAGGSGVAGFECRLDGGTWEPCTSPRALSNLSDGSHTLEVRAIDEAGHRDATPSSRTWTVDTVAPSTSVSTTIPPATNDPDVRVEFGGNDPSGPGSVTFECKLDTGAWVACTSPHTFENLPDGEHTVQIRAVDEAGNPDPSPVTSTFVVDTTAPTTSVTTRPTAITNSPTANVVFTNSDGPGTGVDRVECRTDGGAWTTCTAPLQLTGLADGPHLVEIRAIDELGNAQSPLTRIEWTVDTGAPTTTITGAPEASTQATTADIRFSSADGSGTGVARSECSVDGGAWQPCATQLSLTGLAVGDHEVRIRAVDNAGNVQASPAVTRWTVAAPPVVDPGNGNGGNNGGGNGNGNGGNGNGGGTDTPQPTTPQSDVILPPGYVDGRGSVAAATFVPLGDAADMTFGVSNKNGIRRVVVTLSRGAIFKKGIAKKLKPTITGGKAKVKLVNGDRRIAITIAPTDPTKPVTKIKFKVPRTSIKINIKVKRVLQNKKISAKKRKATLAKILQPKVDVTDSKGVVTPIRVITRIK